MDFLRVGNPSLGFARLRTAARYAALLPAELAGAKSAGALCRHPARPSHDAKTARDATRLPDRLWPQSDSIAALPESKCRSRLGFYLAIARKELSRDAFSIGKQ